MSILYNGSYVNTKQQLWNSYGSNGGGGTASNLYYNESSSQTPTVISMTNTTDGTFTPQLTVVQASLQSQSNGDIVGNSIFRIDYNGSSSTGGNSDIYMYNQNIASGAFNKIWFVAPDATDGGVVLTNPLNSSACILYCDNLGLLHGVVSSGSTDFVLTKNTSYSFQDDVVNTFNQAYCPQIIRSISNSDQNHIAMSENIIVNISVNGFVTPPTVESPIIGGLAPDYIQLAFTINLYYSNDNATSYTLNTVLTLFCNTSFDSGYPVNASFSEVIASEWDVSFGYLYNISVDVIAVDAYTSGGSYDVAFHKLSVTITPQKV